MFLRNIDLLFYSVLFYYRKFTVLFSFCITLFINDSLIGPLMAR